MVENPRLSILCGGYYLCTPAWNRDRTTHKFHDTLDFWMPLAGRGLIETTGGVCHVESGHVYFVPGRHVVRWRWEGETPMYWVATTVESFYLRHRLAGICKVYTWPLASVPWVDGVFHRFVEFFKAEEINPHRERKDEDSRPRDNSPVGLGVKIEGTLMCLIGELVETADKNFQPEERSGLGRLRPAIDFMDAHYLRSPQLSEIAKHAGLVSEYFHRLFKQVTGVTPFKYMEDRRLDMARKLLSEGRLNVKKVAEQTGYHSSSQFSRAFHQRFGVPPSRLRLGP